MTQRTHLDYFLRGRIIGRLECGRTQLEVSDELGIAQSVISRLWQQFEDDGKNVPKTCRKICEVYCENAMSERRTQEWFARFRSGNFDVKGASRFGQEVTEKGRCNFATGESRPASKLSGNSGGTKHQPHDSLETFEKNRLQKKRSLFGCHMN
ncbi:hypothetical protein X975_09441, partial [Stegodyphus mimosarum]